MHRNINQALLKDFFFIYFLALRVQDDLQDYVIDQLII